MMAKLYWRVKRNGKWTWSPAIVLPNSCHGISHGRTLVVDYVEEEE